MESDGWLGREHGQCPIRGRGCHPELGLPAGGGSRDLRLPLDDGMGWGQDGSTSGARPPALNRTVGFATGRDRPFFHEPAFPHASQGLGRLRNLAGTGLWGNTSSPRFDFVNRETKRAGLKIH